MDHETQSAEAKSSPTLIGTVISVPEGFEFAFCKHCGEGISARKDSVEPSRWRHEDMNYRRGCHAASRSEDEDGVGDPELDKRWKATPAK